MEPRKPNPGGEETAEGGTWRGGNGRPQTSVHLWDRDRLLGTFSGCKDQKDYDALSPVCHSRWKWCFTAENMAGGPTNFCLLPNGHFDMFFNFKFYPPPQKKNFPSFSDTSALLGPEHVLGLHNRQFHLGSFGQGCLTPFTWLTYILQNLASVSPPPGRLPWSLKFEP